VIAEPLEKAARIEEQGMRRMAHAAFLEYKTGGLVQG
jgi:hypothetical protein